MTPIAAGVFAGLLERATGQQLGLGRQWRLETSLGPVMKRYGFSTLDALAGAVVHAPEGVLARAAVEALLNHETSFFRDPAMFRALIDEGLALMREARAETKRLRIWSAGCATGQEVYSIAMSLAERSAVWAGWQVSVMGTDISRPATVRARDGLYTHFEAQRGLPITSLIRHFTAEGDSWRIKPELRGGLTFLQQNLLDPPPGRFDVILCRNVLLYFAPERQRAVLDRLAQALAPDGLLMLGAGETVLGQTDAFIVDRELRGLYRPAQ